MTEQNNQTRIPRNPIIDKIVGYTFMLTFGLGLFYSISGCVEGSFDARKWAGIERTRKKRMIDDRQEYKKVESLIPLVWQKAEKYDGEDGLSQKDMAELARRLGYTNEINLDSHFRVYILRDAYSSRPKHIFGVVRSDRNKPEYNASTLSECATEFKVTSKNLEDYLGK